MNEGKPTLVLFPGTWGNRQPRHVKWWWRSVIKYMEDDWNVVLVNYSGSTLQDYIDTALRQTNMLPDGSVAICYSLGAQVARGVATEHPELFRKVVLLSGFEREGIRPLALLSIFSFAFLPLMRVLMGKSLKLDSERQVKLLFLGGTKLEHASALAPAILRNSYPEPWRVVWRLTIPFLRRRMKAFTCPVYAFVPEKDFFVRRATYQGEGVQIRKISGDHALICGEHSRLNRHLHYIHNWLSI